MNGLFFTGTDTGCGKTQVTTATIEALRHRGWRVAPSKPVAAGAELQAGTWCSGDALARMAAAGGKWDYRDVNPYWFPAPVSPHLAAVDVGAEVELGVAIQAVRRLSEGADCVLVEGAGGWLVPLNATQSIADLALAVDLPVVLVVGIRLGCLNHARLTELAITQCGATLAGWVACQVDPHMQRVEENIATLQQHLGSPMLGWLPWRAPAELDLSALETLLGLHRA